MSRARRRGRSACPLFWTGTATDSARREWRRVASRPRTVRAFGKWYHRRFALAGLGIVGKASTKWDVVDENDTPSASYTAYYDNIMVAVKPGACDGANVCKVKTGAACAAAGDCAGGVCTTSVCQ